MNNGKINIEIEELFRKTLENSEITPGSEVKAGLMRKLARKEFLRFNPARFNIYYAAGIVAAAVTAALIFTSGPGESKSRIQNIPVEELKADSAAAVININTAQQGTAGPVRDEKLQPDSRRAQAVKEKAQVNVADEKSSTVRVSRAETDSLRKSGAIRKTVSAENTAAASILRKPYADFEVSAISGCMPLKVYFTNRSVAYDSCRWQFGDGGYSGSANTEYIYDIDGEYRATLKVYGAGGAESVKSIMITVHPKPVAQFEIYPEKPIIPDDEIRFMNYSRDAVKYRWDFGDGMTSESFEPAHRYSRYRDYNVRLIALSEHGCSDSMIVINAFAGSGCFITFPNAFIPNTDGPSGGNYSLKSDESAQVFHPVTSGVSEYQLRIFSKLGILIFESNDINTGWDGYHKGQLCEPGVYVWKVRGTFRNGEPFVKMGDVTLLKQ